VERNYTTRHHRREYRQACILVPSAADRQVVQATAWNQPRISNATIPNQQASYGLLGSSRLQDRYLEPWRRPVLVNQQAIVLNRCMGEGAPQLRNAYYLLYGSPLP
jgi:hypothetical protein